ncbi:Por secretion system C-terminal sorting domain-containing protein [Flavobacteriaceae bacterium MAR_2010_188]|nr:Por secretion system C-terminal sorting domain-containing protein [Flavobacteriaceae bacterium MAR_2010_188]
MRKNLLGSILSMIAIALISAVVFYQKNKSEVENSNQQSSLEEQRQTYQKYLENSPYKETIAWDKKTRKQHGLPPNKYFEQMWELSINPATGKLDDGKLAILREEIENQRQSQRTPGESTNPWEERGPNNVGGRTRVLMFDPNDSSNNTVYAGGVSGGLWKNTNISSSTSTWSRVSNVPGNLSVTSITVDPRNSKRWWVGTGEQYTAGDVVGNGVYVTNDGGNSWSAVNIPAAGPGTMTYGLSTLFLSGIYYVNDIVAWDNGSTTELYVAVGSHVYGDSSDPTNWLGLQSAGLYRSANGGSSWSRIESANMRYTSGSTNYYYIPNDIEVSANNTLWMGTIKSGFGQGGGRVYSSTNGSTWNEAAASPLSDSNRVELECSATNPNKIYALTQGVSMPVHIYSTTNGFGSVSTVNMPNDADSGISAVDFTRGQSFYNLVIEADPANDNVVYVGGINLFKSSNSGSSWSQISHWYGGFGYQSVHADQHAMAFGNNSSSKMLYGNDGGVYYSGNAGGTIGVRNRGYNVTQFVKAGIGPDGPGDVDGIFTAGAQDNGTQAFRNASDGINSSEVLSDGDGFYTFVDKDGQYMISTYVYNIIYRFTLPWNGQGRQQGAATSLSNSQSTGDFVNSMGYDSDANRLLSNNSSGSSYSILSINVEANTNGVLSSSSLTSKPTAFRASPYSNNTWYVGTENGSLLKLTNVANGSANFTNITTPFVGSVSSVRFGKTESELIVTMHNYGVNNVWYSNNGGSSWSNKEGNLPNLPVRDFLLNPLNENEAILATQLGVWRTSNFNDTTPSWSQAYNGMSDVSVTSFDYWNVSGDHTNNKIIASTYGRGVFTGKFTGNTISDTQAPSAPANLSVSSVTQSSLKLNWSASTDNSGVTGYEVYQNSNMITTTTSTNFDVTGLQSNTPYSYYIIAKDAAGNKSEKSNNVSATTSGTDIAAPSAPTTLSVSNITINSLRLNWSASTDNIGVTGYEVYQNSTLISTTTSTYINLSGLISNSAYSYYIIAKDAAGNKSNKSNTVNITTLSVDSIAPSSPSNLTASNITTNSANLSWYSANDNVGVTGYNVYRNGVLIANITGTTYQVSGLSSQTTYIFTVKATDAAGNLSDASNSVDVTTDGGGSITQSYCTSNSNNINDEYISRVQLNTLDNSSGAKAYSDFTDVSTELLIGSSYSITITPTWSGTVYSEAYNVWIDYNHDGDFTDYSESVYTFSASTNSVVSGSFSIPTSAIQGTTRMRISMKYNSNASPCETFTYGEVEDYTIIIGGQGADQAALSPPRNLMANNTTQTATSLTWDAPTDNSAVTGYEVYRGSTRIATLTGRGYNVSGLTPSTSYSFKVLAFDASGNKSGYSNSANVTTLSASDTQAPTAPTYLRASNITENSANLTWNASSDNIGVAGYVVYKNGNQIGYTSSTSFPVTGLNAGTGYYFVVKAKDGAGNLSSASNQVNITTDSITSSCNDGIKNGDEAGVDCGGTSCVPCQTSGPDILHEGFFETGMDNWEDGGSDCYRMYTTASYEGMYSIRLRDDSGLGSSMTLSNLNLEPYNEVEFEFYFYINGMDYGENFFLSYYNGSSWSVIGKYVVGTNFNNNTFYSAAVTLSASQVNFSNNSGFRIECDASENYDQVFIDQVTVAGYYGMAPLKTGIAEHGTRPMKDDWNSKEDFKVYPNPVSGSIVNVVLPGNLSTDYRIINMMGQTVSQGHTDKEVNVSELQTGLYFIEVNDGDETMTKKFVRN